MTSDVKGVLKLKGEPQWRNTALLSLTYVPEDDAFLLKPMPTNEYDPSPATALLIKDAVRRCVASVLMPGGIHTKLLEWYASNGLSPLEQLNSKQSNVVHLNDYRGKKPKDGE
jgi:hypothetical protein